MSRSTFLTQTVVGAAIITAMVFSPPADELFFAIVLLGPLLSGLAAALLHRSWHPVAAAWALSGLVMLIADWAINNEDQLFHVVLTLVMVGLTALGAAIGRLAQGANASGTVSASKARMQ
jgi:hypothetical protein